MPSQRTFSLEFNPIYLAEARAEHRERGRHLCDDIVAHRQDHDIRARKIGPLPARSDVDGGNARFAQRTGQRSPHRPLPDDRDSHGAP